MHFFMARDIQLSSTIPLQSIPRPTNWSWKRYNYAHAQQRNVVESTFGIWKQHFPGLSRRLGNSSRHCYRVCSFPQYGYHIQWQCWNFQGTSDIMSVEIEPTHVHRNNGELQRSFLWIDCSYEYNNVVSLYFVKDYSLSFQCFSFSLEHNFLHQHVCVTVNYSGRNPSFMRFVWFLLWTLF